MNFRALSRLAALPTSRLATFKSLPSAFPLHRPLTTSSRLVYNDPSKFIETKTDAKDLADVLDTLNKQRVYKEDLHESPIKMPGFGYIISTTVDIIKRYGGQKLIDTTE